MSSTRQNFFFLILFVYLVIAGFSKYSSLSAYELKATNITSLTELMVKRIVVNEYMIKMKLKVLATEGVREIRPIKIGYDIPGFAKKGDKIWEARIETLEGDFRAIIWINLPNSKPYFVVGPWAGY